MADNIILEPGVGGATLATDEIAAVQYQRIKLVHGVDGVNDGDVSRANPFPVDPYQLESAQVTHTTAAALAAGGSTDLDSATIASGLTGKLVALVPAATVPIKVELKTVLNGVESAVLLTLFRHAFQGEAWVAPAKAFFTQAESATPGFDGFRATVTNLDNSQAADVYVTFLYDETA